MEMPSYSSRCFSADPNASCLFSGAWVLVRKSSWTGQKINTANGYEQQLPSMAEDNVRIADETQRNRLGPLTSLSVAPRHLNDLALAPVSQCTWHLEC